MQAEVVKLALDLLVREPDVEGFFGGLTKTMVEESESYTCAVWLIDETVQQCNLWMAYVKDRLFTPPKGVAPCAEGDPQKGGFPCEIMAAHLFAYTPGWTQTVEYELDDPRLPVPIHEFSQRAGCGSLISTPLLLGSRTLGWMTIANKGVPEPDSQWWRVVLIEAIARQAALALHHSRLVELNRLDERRKAILSNTLWRHHVCEGGWALVLCVPRDRPVRPGHRRVPPPCGETPRPPVGSLTRPSARPGPHAYRGHRSDQAPVYPAVLEELLPAAWHRTDRYANSRIEADHSRVKARLRPMRGLKQDRTAGVVIAGHAFIQNLRRGHYELAVEEPANRRLTIAFDELALVI